MSEKCAIVEEFAAAWSQMDLDQIMSFMTEETVYHNIPMAPLKGLDAIRTFIQGFVAGALLTGILATLVFYAPDSVQAQNKKKKFQELVTGGIPDEFGELKSVTEQSGKLKMFFVDENNKIRIVEMSGGNKVVMKAYVIERPY